MNIKKPRYIRLFPISKNDFPSYECVRVFIENGFHKDGELYPECISISMDYFYSNTLVLFQYGGQIIGSGIIRIQCVEEPYRKYVFCFDMDSVKILEKPITSTELRKIDKDFKKFTSVAQKIDIKYVEQITDLIRKKTSTEKHVLDECSSVVFDKSEGGKVKYYTTKYERVNKYRLEAIRIHGLKCEICGFDFAETYGSLGNGYIEVHHKKPCMINSEAN